MPKQVRDALSPASVRNLAPGRYADGNGLYLLVTDSGARMWIWRGVIQGRRRELGMGSTSFVALKDARETARQWKRIAHEGGDPAAHRDRQKAARLTFAEAAQKCWADRIDGHLRSAHSATVWLNPIRMYAFPALGKKPLPAIAPADIKTVLAPIWATKPETGRKVRQRLRVVFDWARASGHLDGANPCDGVTLALPRQTDARQHFAALPWKDMPALWPRLEAASGMGATALRFVILTACRTGEARGAMWDEIDLEERVWMIPGRRTKTGKLHRIPLSDAAVGILEAVRPLAGDHLGLVFPSARPGKALSDMTVSAVLKRMRVPCTVHGFRSTARDWAEDCSIYGHEVKEAMLAHVVRNRAEAAYRRSDQFEKRRGLMRDWANFVTGAGADVDRLAHA